MGLRLTGLAGSFILLRTSFDGATPPAVTAIAGPEDPDPRDKEKTNMAVNQPGPTPSDLSRRGFLQFAAAAGAAAPAAILGGPGARRAWAQETPKRGGTLRVGFYIEAATMDPHLSGSKIDRQVYHNIYEPLIVLDTN